MSTLAFTEGAEEARKERGGLYSRALLFKRSDPWRLSPFLSLLLSRALTGAQTFLRQYITLVTKRHSTLLLPVTPNPRPYVPPGTTSPPAGQESQQLYLTANPDLNFAQMALALTVQAVSAQKSGARVPDTLKNAWMALVRQYEREGAALEQDESVREVSRRSLDLREKGSAGIQNRKERLGLVRWCTKTLQAHVALMCKTPTLTRSLTYSIFALLIRQAIPALSKIYFHIQPPRSQGNMLQEMMANLFGGPPGGSGSTDDAQVVLPRQAPPPARLQAPSPAAETAGEPEEEDLD